MLDWPRSWGPSTVIGGSLCFIEANNKVNYFHRPIKNTQKYNDICLIVFILSVMVSSSSSPRACIGPRGCSSVGGSVMCGFRHSNTLFGARKYNFNDNTTYSDDEIHNFDGEMRYSNAEISISLAQPFISGPKDNILAPKSCISPTKYDHPHPNTPPDARKHNPDDETTQFDDELRHSDTETRYISNRIRILIQKQYTSTRVT